MGIGKIEIILLIILVIVMLFVGGKKLPELAKGVGQSFKELKRGFKDDEPDEKPKAESKKETKK